jgi:hypothetical protein
MTSTLLIFSWWKYWKQRIEHSDLPFGEWIPALRYTSHPSRLWLVYIVISLISPVGEAKRKKIAEIRKAGHHWLWEKACQMVCSLSQALVNESGICEHATSRSQGPWLGKWCVSRNLSERGGTGHQRLNGEFLKTLRICSCLWTSASILPPRGPKQ